MIDLAPDRRKTLAVLQQVSIAGRGGETYVIPAYYLIDVFRRALVVERLGAARRVV